MSLCACVGVCLTVIVAFSIVQTVCESVYIVVGVNVTVNCFISFISYTASFEKHIGNRYLCHFR